MTCDDGPEAGQYLFLFPMTTEIAKAMGITTKNTGLMVGYKPPPGNPGEVCVRNLHGVFR